MYIVLLVDDCMAPPVSASFITMLVMLYNSPMALCCCLRRVGLALCGVS